MTVMENGAPGVIVPIVVAFDDGYAPIFGVCLQSMLERFSKEKRYELIVLEDAVGDARKAMFSEQIRGRDNVRLRYVKMEGYFDEAKKYSGWGSKTVFYPLLLPNIFPEYNKLIYLDVDTIILRDIAELYGVDLCSNYVGACLALGIKYKLMLDWQYEYESGNITIKEYFDDILRLDSKQIKNYFNSGVMVFDVEKMRTDNIVDKLLSAYNEKQYLFVDQDIFNKVLGHNVMILDGRWNFATLRNSLVKSMSKDFCKAYCDSKNDFWILHFAGTKPWNDATVRFSDIFWLYCKKTPFYKEIQMAFLQRQIEVLRKRLKDLWRRFGGLLTSPFRAIGSFYMIRIKK